MFGLYFRFIFLVWYILVPLQPQSISLGWQSTIVFSDSGFEFSPIDTQALLVHEGTADSKVTCSQNCHSNALCRIFDFDDRSGRCRIFEGDVVTMGSIVASSSSQSYVGSLELNPEQFAYQGQPCSFCEGSRYLICINSTCQCQRHTFFDGSICRSQKLLGTECINETECRMDLNFTCLPRQQCGPLSLQSGTTVGGYGNGTAGAALDALSHPWGLAFGLDGSLFVAEYGNNRVIKLREGSLMGTLLAGTSVAGNGANQFYAATGLFVDESSNIYVGDDYNCRVMLWLKNSSSGVIVAGTGNCSNSASTISYSAGLAVDSQKTIYLSDQNNNRVMKWKQNATYGTRIAGTGTMGSGSQQLYQPYGLYLDELNSYLYIADAYNHRIQRYYLGVMTNVTTVAGGNGPGSGNNQLNTPNGVCVSKKTGAIYIADAQNHRIQRWSPGATSGVTIVGIADTSGTTSTLLNWPVVVVLSPNETFLYVSDTNNNRVQRFELI